MRVGLAQLRRYVDLPADEALHQLFDDVGLEVKRNHGTHFTLELLANRGDHRCYVGVAVELHGRLGGGLRVPTPPALAVGTAPHPVELRTHRCLAYTLTVLKRVGPDSPIAAEALDLLLASGLTSVLPAVDATNLSSTELGQPTHVFDADRVVGPVVIRESVLGDEAWPLFTPGKIGVPVGSIVIADSEKILAIAGVIGCEDSKVTESTKSILLESATFDPVAVRIASRALGIQTEASARFERGADPSAPLVGAARVVQLLEETGAWKRVGATCLLGEWTDPRRTISLDLGAAHRFLGVALPFARAAELLGRYGFELIGDDDIAQVLVPPVRLWDVVTPADIHEELARAIGYNALPARLPPVDAGASPSEAELRRDQIDEVVLSHGFYEVVTDGFYGRPLVDALGVREGHPLFAHVETLNAQDRAYSLLKNNALAQAMETVATNSRVKTAWIRAFEWTHTFHLTQDFALSTRTSPARERKVLWMVAAGAERPPHWSDKGGKADVWMLSGLVDAIGAEIGLPLRIAVADPDQPLWSLLHPHRQACVSLRGKTIGILGEVHPRVCTSMKLRQVPVYLELDGAALLAAPAETPAYTEAPAMPPMRRQLTFVLPRRVAAGAVAGVIQSASSIVEGVMVADLFALEDGASAVTFDLRYAASRERTAEEVNEITLRVAAQVALALPGVTLRV